MAVDASSPPDPAPILHLVEAFRHSKTMFAAVGLGVFDALEEGPKPLDALAPALGVDADALGRLLDACVHLGLLTRSESGYADSPASAAYLTSKSPRRLTGYVNYSNAILWKLWGNLEGAIREGTNRWKETYGWDGPIFDHMFATETSKREFLMGMHGFGMISSPEVVAAFDLSRFRTLADLGGATGHLAVAACERYPQLQGVVFDLPAVMPLAREIVGGSLVSDRIRLEPGDFFNDPLPQADLYALGRIVHDWTEAKCLKLLARIHDALPSGGGLLIAEKMLDEDKTGPRWALMQSLNMLTCTEGKERSLTEYRALLGQVGFRDVIGCRTMSPLDAILAVKS